MSNKQTYTAQQNFLFLALLQVKYAKQKQSNEELLNILLLVVRATRLCQNDNCFSGMDASDENCCEFAKANSIAQTAGTPFERYELNYNLDYEYDSKFVHRAKRIGKQHYLYDLNGNLISEQEGAYNEAEASSQHEVIQTGNLYSVDYGWGIVNPDATPTSTPNITRRNYTWNERNLLKTSTDRSYSVQYKYGADGQRSAKYSVGSHGVSETLYFNKMWNWRYDSRIMQREGRVSKHIYLGETRILTKLASADNDLSAIVSEELTKQYYYHTDHLGSAQLISDHAGKEYERIEYTPYGELWIEKKTTISQIDIPFRFTGKERDEETGLYYYGARYLDAKTSRWLSTDPALGEYIPQAPINDEAKKRNGKLPGMGGVFNTVNSHLYHYAGNNPVKYTDPDGKAENLPFITPREVSDFILGSAGAFFKGVGASFADIGGQVTNFLYNVTHGNASVVPQASFDLGDGLFTITAVSDKGELEFSSRSMPDGKNIADKLQQMVGAPIQVTSEGISVSAGIVGATAKSNDDGTATLTVTVSLKKTSEFAGFNSGAAITASTQEGPGSTIKNGQGNVRKNANEATYYTSGKAFVDMMSN